jgi:hypothetical protein
MAIALKSKPGITTANTLSIPTNWDAAWFRSFIANKLQGADVRNAVGANGITVSGTIASPYATISLSGPSTITGPLTVNGNNATPAIIINAPSGQSPYEEFSINGVPEAYIGVAGVAGDLGGTGSSANDLVLRSQGANIDFTANSGASVQMQLTAAGNLSIGGTSYAWATPTTAAVDIGSYGGIATFSGASVVLISNAYYNGTNWIAKGTAGAAYVQCNPTGGTQGIYFWAAPSVTAGSVLTFTELMTVLSTGVTINTALSLSAVTVTTTSPAAGGAGALPATPAGYMAITIAGVARRIPFYT